MTRVQHAGWDGLTDRGLISPAGVMTVANWLFVSGHARRANCPAQYLPGHLNSFFLLFLLLVNHSWWENMVTPLATNQSASLYLALVYRCLGHAHHSVQSWRCLWPPWYRLLAAWNPLSVSRTPVVFQAVYRDNCLQRPIDRVCKSMHAA